MPNEMKFEESAKNQHALPPQGAVLHGRRGAPKGPIAVMIGGLAVVGAIGYFTLCPLAKSEPKVGPSGGARAI